MPSKVSVAPNRNKQPHYVHLAGTGCPHLLALYWLMVFIQETPVMPYSGKVKTKRHLFSCLLISGSECCPMCQLLQTGTNYYITSFGWYFWNHLLALYWLMVFIHETHVMPSSGKVKTKRYLLSYLVLAGSECRPKCQLLKQEQITTLRTFGRYWLHQSSGFILIDGDYSWNTCDAI